VADAPTVHTPLDKAIHMVRTAMGGGRKYSLSQEKAVILFEHFRKIRLFILLIPHFPIGYYNCLVWEWA
jgi:hypothetical protein